MDPKKDVVVDVSSTSSESSEENSISVSSTSTPSSSGAEGELSCICYLYGKLELQVFLCNADLIFFLVLRKITTLFNIIQDMFRCDTHLGQLEGDKKKKH